MGFVKTPYLPQKKVTLAVADCERWDVNIIKPYCVQILPEGLRNHADLSFCYLGDGECVVAPESYDYYKKQFENTDVKIMKGEKKLDMHYPLDAAYNVAIVGKKVFCRKDITDGILLRRAEEKGYEIININQGYAKCSVCPIDEKSAISADESFYKAATKAHLEVLKITNDTIQLKGYDNGFFGGCAYMSDFFNLYINGDITSHPDCEKILDFMEKKQKRVKLQKSGFLYDFGSFIPIMEE